MTVVCSAITRVFCAPQAQEMLEFYFGDSNLLKDRFMRQKIEASDGGWISLELLATFKKLREMTNGDDALHSCGPMS